MYYSVFHDVPPRIQKPLTLLPPYRPICPFPRSDIILQIALHALRIPPWYMSLTCRSATYYFSPCCVAIKWYWYQHCRNSHDRVTCWPPSTTFQVHWKFSALLCTVHSCLIWSFASTDCQIPFAHHFRRISYLVLRRSGAHTTRAHVLWATFCQSVRSVGIVSRWQPYFCSPLDFDVQSRLGKLEKTILQNRSPTIQVS